jgi:CPA2 family monovalent cation:H+ antiporter-2
VPASEASAFEEILVLLAVAVAAVSLLQRFRLPSSLGYLVVGALIGPHALGWISDAEHNRVLAQFGIVFLLFTIGLNYSLPQILAMRNVLLGLGTGQVALTTAAVAAIAWAAGLSGAGAFVVGAVYAQSSTTIIARQLAEQGEEQTRHARLGVGISVFQDVTAVPFIIIVPVLAAAGTEPFAGPLALALAKGVLAFAIIVVAGRWVLRPLLQAVAERRSPELLTLTVLLVVLAAAWTTSALGLSLALGAFLAGMMLGETPFRLQLETTMRPFRDVLLGLFFVTIGMLVDVRVLPAIWHWVALNAVAMLILKAALVFGITRIAGIDARAAVRTGLLVAVGGEFGFALLALALDSDIVSPLQAQTVLNSVLLSMILAPFLIRYNGELARLLVPRAPRASDAGPRISPPPDASRLREHVIICGYGRIGQNVGRFLAAEGKPYVALDLDAALVREAHGAGEPVYFGDASEREMLEAVGIDAARLLVVSHEDIGAARKILAHARSLNQSLPIMVRTRDETHVEELGRLGATEVVAETLEAGMMIASHALLLVGVPASRVMRRMREAQSDRYQLLREVFRGTLGGDGERERLYTVELTPECRSIGRSLREIGIPGSATALIRGGVRNENPDPGAPLQAGDVVVLYGEPQEVAQAERKLLLG